MTSIVPDEVTYEVFNVVSSTTGPFNFGFQHTGKPSLRVTVDNVDVDFNLTPGSVVDAAGYDGGSFSLLVAVANARVVIYRLTTVERDANLSGANLTFAGINGTLNEFAYTLQEMRRDIDRALLANFGESLGPIDNEDLAAVSDIASEVSIVAEIDAEILINAGMADEIVTVAALAGDIGSLASSVVKTTALYASAAALTGLVNGQFVYIGGRSLVNDGGGGLFRYQEGDYTAQVTADTQKGRYLPLSADPTGATGVLVRQLEGPALFDILDYAATGDNATECAANLNATLSAVPTSGSIPGGIVTMQNGRYLLGTALTVPDYTTLTGQGATTTRLNFNSLASGNAILCSGQDYYNTFTDFLVENAPAYALETLDGSNSLFMNLAILGKTTGTTSGGIQAGTNSYMNAFINIRATDMRAHGWNNSGFTTSQLLLNYFVLGSDDSAFIWNHTVYSCGINTGSDDSLEHGHEFTNANGVTLVSPGIERSTKAPFKFQAGASLDPLTVANVKDVKDVVIVGAFMNDCGGSGEATAIEAIATDNRVIRALFLGGHDDNAAGGSSVDIDGAYVHILAIGGQFPGGVTAANSATFGHMKYDENGLTFDINGTRRMRIDEATTSFTNTLNNAYGFIFSGTTNSIGEVGLWIRPGDTNASARDWGIGLGRHARGDFAITQGTSVGANPVSGNTRLLINSSGDVIIGANSGPNKLSVNGIVSPTTDNARTLGAASYRWSEVFAGNATINTSDARHKTPLRPFSEAEKRAICRVMGGTGIYQWLASVAEKGDAARLHAGITAQALEAAFHAEGLNPERYALFCEDPVFETVETPIFEPVLDENGEQAYEQVQLLDDEGRPVFEEVEVRTIISVRVRDGEGRQTGAEARNEIKEVVSYEMKPVMVRGKPIIAEHIHSEQVRKLDEDGNPLTIKGVRYEELIIMVLAVLWETSVEAA